MPANPQDKVAWQWVEGITHTSHVSPQHVLTAYRGNLQPCPRGKCRRNCRGNPFCLNALGEKSWFKDIDERCVRDFDPNSERREEGKFVGLKNLGATCYVNTFLQLWFLNVDVRQAVYRWRESQQPDKTDSDWKPSSICGHLQLLFGLMQHSQRAYIDPSPLIECLGLDTREQQDAQEFSKLFLSVLEKALTQESLSQSSSVIQQQFAGTYCYVTRCLKCGGESSCKATFYELDVNISGHSTLTSSLQGFLKEERLEGENQYMCSTCGSKQNAARFIRLLTLPPVLNLQLLRFVFDVKKGHKKKINSSLLFDDVLDMSAFLGQSPGGDLNGLLYDLTAVLVHRGASAYSGHYVAHIQDPVSKLWHKFNDETISVMKGRKFQLEKDEDIFTNDCTEQGGSPSSKRIPKGTHSSRNAYMLVYSRRQQADSAEKGEDSDSWSSCQLPQCVQNSIDQDNATFENWIQEILLVQDSSISSQKEKQKQMQSIYLALQCSSLDEDWEWAPVDWLRGWLADPDKTQPLTLSPYLCQHNRLHPDHVVDMKVVRTAGMDQLIDLYGGNSRLKRDTLCSDCVRQRCEELQFHAHLAECSRLLSAALKQPVDSSHCFWIGKRSLRSWKRYALDETASKFSTSIQHCAEENNVETVGSAGEAETVGSAGETETVESAGEAETVGSAGEAETVGSAGEAETVGSAGEAERPGQPGDQNWSSEHLRFNSDLLCDHGALRPDQACRRLVSEEAWRHLRSLFPSCPEFGAEASVCEVCQARLAKEQERRRQTQELYNLQKHELRDLYLGRNRPQLDQPHEQPVFVLAAEFLDMWKTLVKSREDNPDQLVHGVCNRLLLCEHDRLLYDLRVPDDRLSDSIVLLWEHEWKLLVQHYAADAVITVLARPGEGSGVTIATEPEPCEDCVARRVLKEEEEQFIFTQAVVFVRKAALSQLSAGPDTGQTTTDLDWDEIKNDASLADAPLLKRQKFDGEIVRKSQRHRRQRGEREVKVSSDLTLRDFKVKVMNAFSIPTFDQHLSIDGRPVSDNEATLGQLHFYPGCIVLVKADEPLPESLAAMETTSARKLEEGFKGTSLMNH